MHHISNTELTLAAVVVEAAVGYPDFVYRAIGHPVTWMGALVGGLERRLNRAAASPGWRRILGALALMALLATTAGVCLLLGWGLSFGVLGAGLQVLAASSLIAQRSLHDHVRAVAAALERDGLDAGRAAVSMIVGRNPSNLDEAGVARAAIESLAENFSDGIVAPAFWLAVGGLPGAACYKATNTADSMIGHRTHRYAAFGWAAARLDDVTNLPASRLSAFFLFWRPRLSVPRRETPRRRFGEMRTGIARQTPDGRKPPWRAHWVCNSPDPGSMATRWSTTLSWGTGAGTRPVRT